MRGPFLPFAYYKDILYFLQCRQNINTLFERLKVYTGNICNPLCNVMYAECQGDFVSGPNTPSPGLTTLMYCVRGPMPFTSLQVREY